jgi:peptide/nickel transport system permease protein
MSPWFGFIGRRLLRVVTVIIALVVAGFMLVRLIPGDPARAVLGPSATPEQVTAVRAQLGLDDPLWIQFVDYSRGLLTGDLGESFESQQPVAGIITESLPVTVTVAVEATILVLVVSLVVGMGIAILARNGRGRVEFGFLLATSVAGGLPEYVAGTLLVLVFAISLDWLPVAGVQGPLSFVLPVLAVSIGPAATLARIVRREMATVLESDYLRTARAKRLPAGRMYLRHALPNVMTGTLTYSGLLLVGLLGGTVVAESVFNLPGTGRVIVQAVLSRDYPVIQAALLAIGLMAVLVTLVVDIAIRLADPRSGPLEAHR